MDLILCSRYQTIKNKFRTCTTKSNTYTLTLNSFGIYSIFRFGFIQSVSKLIIMKKITVFLLLALFHGMAISQVQQIKIVSFNVKSLLPANPDDWQSIPGALILVAQTNPGARVKEGRLVIQIKSNGGLVCGTNPGTAQAMPDFTTRSFSTPELVGMMGNCHDLKEGSYSLCAQFFNIDRIPISQEMCREFRVEVAKAEDYTSPTLILPDNDKKFTEAELSRPINFRWTPLVPKPQQPVTYKLRVWQLMQGQNGIQAMKSNQPNIEKEVRDLNQTIVTGVVTGPCRPPYMCDFVWDVQALNKDGKPMGNNNGYSELFHFSAQQTGSIKAPVNLLPENNKSIPIGEAMKSVQFKWKPVDPNPNGPITYRLRVWQLMQGQQPQTAMRSNQPIVTKDIINHTELTVTGVITGPCRPPYMCDYVWDVQALNSQGQPVGENNGTSEPTVFLVSQYIIQIDSIKVSCTATPGVYSFSYTITNPNAGTAKLTNFVVTSSIPGAASISSFTPPLNTPILSGNQLTITGTINGSPSLSNICIGAEITDMVNTFWKAARDTCVAVQPCKCDKCDGEKVVFNIPSINTVVFNYNNNSFSFAQPITISTTPYKPVKNLKAELVYYEFLPESEECLPCNKDSKTYGNFATGIIGNVTGNGSGTHSLEFIFNPAKNFSIPATANISISMPPTVGCCAATIRWCIRWVATFEDGKDCFVCNKLVCYETHKEGCQNIFKPTNIKQ